MTLLRSGLVLYVSVTALATLVVAVWYLCAIWNHGWYPWPPQTLLIPSGFSAVTLPTVATLVIAASLGRKRPVLDGLLLIGGIGLLACYCLYLMLRQSDDPMTFSWAGLVAQMYYLVGLAVAVPSYLIAYYALRQAGLIAELTPTRKTKELTEATP